MKQYASFLLLIVLTSCDSLTSVSYSPVGSKNLPLVYRSAQIERAHASSGKSVQAIQPEKEMELSFNSATTPKKTILPSIFPAIPHTDLDRKRSAKTTIYFVPSESDTRYVGKKIRCLNVVGEKCVKVSQSFYDEVKMQGTGILADGRTINVADETGRRYKVTESRFGLGDNDNPLIPFRSIAIDKDHYGVNNGDKVFIPATKGMLVPGTNIVHDGYWIVNDVGSAISGSRIDLFTGTMHWQDFQDYLKSPANFEGNRIAEGSQKLGDKRLGISIYI
ncbi:MAG: hypothetical protein KA116_09300 [Proteobacteria bacterium]|nr:hypothetical protein [Pseudomonadota bacterium]